MRADTDLPEVIQMVGGIAKIPTSEPGQIDHILDIALDGLRYRAARRLDPQQRVRLRALDVSTGVSFREVW